MNYHAKRNKEKNSFVKYSIKNKSMIWSSLGVAMRSLCAEQKKKKKDDNSNSKGRATDLPPNHHQISKA